MKNVWEYTAQEAADAWERHLLQKPEGPWESAPVLVWRERKAMLELVMLIHPVPNQANSEPETPVSLPAPRSRQSERRKPRHLRPFRRIGVIA